MSFVASAIKAVVNVVEDVVETVVGVVEDVADFVVEEIIEPVVEVVDTVVTAVIEDPVATILTVAAAVTPGMSWTIPLINAADTVAKGGNIGDAVKAAAIGYVAPKVGTYVSGAVTSATGSAVAGSVAGVTASGVVKGKNLKEALIGGVAGEIASASIDVVKNNIPNYDTISSPGADSAIEKGVAKYIESGGNVTEAALAAASTNLGTVLKDNTNFNGDISDALSAGLVAGLQDPEAALPTFKASLNAAGVKDLNAKIDDYLYTPSKEEIAAEEAEKARLAEEARVAEEARLNEIADNKLIEEARVAEEAKLAEEVRLTELKAAEDKAEAARLIAEADTPKTAEEVIEEIEFADTSDLGKAFTSETDLLDKETAFDESEFTEVATIDDDLTGLLSDDTTEKKDTSYLADYEPVTIGTPIDRRRLEDEIDRMAAAGEEVDYVGAMSKDPYAEERLSIDIDTLKTNASALGLNSISGTAEAMALNVEGIARTLDYYLSQMDPTGNLTRQVNGVWAGDRYVQTTPSMRRKAEEEGINVEEWKKQNFGSGLSDDEKRAKVDELVKQYAYKYPKKFFVNATSGAVTFLDDYSREKKAAIDSDLLVRMHNALPAEGMTLGEALPGSTGGPMEERYGTNIALDRLGRPYGTDEFATLLNASEEFGDVFVDALVSKIPFVGDALNVAFGYAEGTAAAMRDIEKATKQALDNGELDNIVEWQKILSESDGDATKALDRLNTSFFKTAQLAGSVEGFADAATARLITKTKGVKTIGDLYNKLTPAVRKSLGITLPVGIATGIGGGTEALQQRITEDSLKKFGITVENEQGAAFLLGAAGQGGAVSVATVSGGIINAIKTKYKNGDVSPEALAFINEKVISPDGSDYDPDFITVDERRKADAAFKTAEEARLEPSSLNPAFEAAGVSPAGITADPTGDAELDDLINKTKETAVEDVLADLEEAGVSPAGTTGDIGRSILDIQLGGNSEFATIAERFGLTRDNVNDVDVTTIKTALNRGVAAGTIDRRTAFDTLNRIDTRATLGDIDAFADLEATGEIPAPGIVEDTAVADVIENLESEAADTPTGIASFTTAKGSTYKLTPESTTERNRAARDDNEKSGPMPRSGKTVYMDRNSSAIIGGVFQNPEVPVKFVPDTTNNTAKLIHLDNYGPLSAGDDATPSVNYSLTPEIGLYPVEIFDSNNSNIRNVHFGSEIIDFGTLEATGEIPAGETTKEEETTKTSYDIATDSFDADGFFGDPRRTRQDLVFDTKTGTYSSFGEIAIGADVTGTDVIENLESEIADTPTGIVEDTVTTPYTDTTVDTDTDVTPNDVVAILGGDTDAVTDTDINTVEEIVNIVKSEVDASTDTTTDTTETATDTTVSPVISVNTDLPEEDEERRRRRKKAREQAYLQATGQSVDPNNIAGIDYLYDFKSKFANPQQAEQFDLDTGKFNRPYDLTDIIATGEQPEPQKPVANDDFLQLIEAAKMNPDIINQETRGLNLFPVDETEKIGINSPYTTESKEDTTQRLLNLINNNKA